MPVLAGPCNGVKTVPNLRGLQRLSQAAWHLVNLDQMMGMLIVSLPLTWLVKSSVGYAGKLGPGASRLGAGSRFPTGL